MSSVYSFFYSQLFVKLPHPTQSFSGQTVIVTGSNTGLGLEAARHFTRLGAAKVILAVRTLSKGEAAKESIEKSTDQKGVVEVWHLDLGNYESVKEFAKKAGKLDRLDVLVENAGINKSVWSVLEDNEATITTNVISTFLLGILLLPKLRESGQKFNSTPHLAIVSSEVHFWSPMNERKSKSIFDALNDKETANMADRYTSTSTSSPSLYPLILPPSIPTNQTQIQHLQAPPSLPIPRTRRPREPKQQAKPHHQLPHPRFLPFRPRSGPRLLRHRPEIFPR